MVIIIEVNFPPVCFITSFYKRIFLNNYRLANGCSSAFTVKEGLWILLKTLAAAFPFNKLICHDAPIVIKLLRDIKGILNLTSYSKSNLWHLQSSSGFALEHTTAYSNKACHNLITSLFH